MRAKSAFLSIILIFVFLCCGCVPEADIASPKQTLEINFMAGYKPQANLPFVGVYVAQEKGFFANEAVEVTIQHSAGQGQHLQFLTAGKVDVTTQDAAILLKRRADPSLPLVSIALIGQRGQQAFAALQSAGFSSPADWAGHTVGYKGAPPPELPALIQLNGVDPADVELVNVGFDPRVLTEGRVDVYPVFKSNEPFLIQSWGYQVTLWDPADYDIPSMGLAYVTSDDILEQKPEALVRFLRAALKGIAYAETHVDEAVEIVLKYTGPETNPQHMRFMLQQELGDAQSNLTELKGFGWQSEEQWRELMDFLVEHGEMTEINPADVFTTTILEQAR